MSVDSGTVQDEILSPNQLVALNLRRARLLAGWTQQEACIAAEPVLGRRLTKSSWSQMERTAYLTGGRRKVFDVSEVVGFAQVFDVPVVWFFLPSELDTTVQVGCRIYGGKDLVGLVMGIGQSLTAYLEAVEAYGFLDLCRSRAVAVLCRVGFTAEDRKALASVVARLDGSARLVLDLRRLLRHLDEAELRDGRLESVCVDKRVERAPKAMAIGDVGGESR